ncbi:SprB repeat-containing protein [Ohtaekwangia koreensis]|uniref:SprB repeat-containing protein n=2 Tax=Ohtaekwangia koreensis TaxID=688867 RepID=A0A1T5K6U4_9BACT|nr:SprB repeat-containing protein [Ohtaekwangia koreensis]
MKQLILRSYIVIVSMILSMSIAKGQATYPSNWTDRVNVIVNADNSLTKSVATTGYVSGAASENILASGVDGYIQFTYTASAANQYYIGFTGLNNSTDVYYNLYSYLVSSTGSCAVYQRNASKFSVGALANGDILKIAREGENIKFYRNGTAVYTSYAAGNSLYNLRADVSISAGTAPAIACSFDRKLIAKPTFQYPNYTNANGAIALQVEGGTAPFTYQWSSGEQTASITGKPRGTYSVTVTDAAGKTFAATYSLGYSIGWKNAEGVTVNADNTLRRSASTGWDAGASSLNILPDNADGWVEFVITDPAATYIMGFSNFDPNTSFNYIRFALCINELGGINIYESNVSKGSFGSIVKGDVIRLSREGAYITYSKNGTTLRSVNVTDKILYLIDVSVYNTLGPLPPITASFEQQVQFKPVITLPNASNNTNGSIAVAVEGTYPPSATQWSSGETTNAIGTKSRDTYTATVTDASGRSQSRSYMLGYPVYWNDLRNVAVTAAGGLTKNGSTASFFDAGGISSNRLLANENGSIETVINRTSGGQNYYFLGLTRFNNSAGNTNIDYAFYLHPEGYFYIVENNVYRNRVSFREGNVLKIAREGSLIKYYVDGEVVRTVSTDPSYVLHADCSIAWGTIPLVTASFYTPKTFYAVADGNWTGTGIWSFTSGGSAASSMPGYGDIVYVNQHAVNITTAITCGQLNIVAGGTATAVTVSGSVASLTAEEIKIKGDNNGLAQQVLQVKESAKLTVKSTGL